MCTAVDRLTQYYRFPSNLRQFKSNQIFMQTLTESFHPLSQQANVNNY